MEASAGLNLPDPGVHIPYTIVAQEPRQELVGRRFVDGMEITYTTPSGVQDVVFVPRSEYDPAMVDRIIEAKLQQIESVAALGAVPHPENLTPGA